MCTTYFAAAVGGLVGEHVVVNFCNWWLPGDERAAVIHFTGCQVHGRVHGCQKETKISTFMINVVQNKEGADGQRKYISLLGSYVFVWSDLL